jgi:plasmid stabilization system protein ParE
MLRSLRWSRNAEEDIIDIVSYIAGRSGSLAAAKIYDKIKARVIPLIDFPETGRVVPELARLGIEYIRQVTEKPWKIYYRIVGDEIWVLAVIDERRNLEEILYTKIIEGKRIG